MGLVTLFIELFHKARCSGFMKLVIQICQGVHRVREASDAEHPILEAG
jgi:hypothetical protein